MSELRGVAFAARSNIWLRPNRLCPAPAIAVTASMFPVAPRHTRCSSRRPRSSSPRKRLAPSGASPKEATAFARSFCEVCGTPLFAENADYPEFIAIKVGSLSLSDPSVFKPAGHI